MNELIQQTQLIVERLKAAQGNSNYFQSADERSMSITAIESIIEKQISRLDGIIQERVRNEFFKFGPLNSILDDLTITEVLINSPQEIWIERSGQLEAFEDQFLSEYTYEQILNKIYLEIEKEPNLETPFIDAFWRGFRVHIIFPYDGLQKKPRISLRSLRTQHWTLDRLIEENWSDKNKIEDIKKLIQKKANLLIIGPTSAGKTSVLSALIKEVPPKERVVLIEDSLEISLPEGAHTRLLTRKESESLSAIHLEQLIKQSLRMRPDRLVIGEVRSAEACDLLLALSTGHKGSMCTLHAHSAIEALQRLEMLIQMGQPNWSLQTIRRLIQTSIDFILVCQKSEGKRTLNGLFKISSLEDFGFLLEKEI